MAVPFLSSVAAVSVSSGRVGQTVFTGQGEVAP